MTTICYNFRESEWLGEFVWLGDDEASSEMVGPIVVFSRAGYVIGREPDEAIKDSRMTK